MNKEERFEIVSAHTIKDKLTSDYLELEECCEILNQQNQEIQELKKQLNNSIILPCIKKHITYLDVDSELVKVDWYVIYKQKDYDEIFTIKCSNEEDANQELKRLNGEFFSMGMDYSYAGSESYSRFREELCEVARIFNGTINERKFVFPDGINDILVKWFNSIYDVFTLEETETIWAHVSTHPEIKDISSQIWYELEISIKLNEPWRIWK